MNREPSKTGDASLTLAERIPIRILVVDDESTSRYMVTSLLQKLGYQPDIANDGLEAVAAVAKTPCQLIFMDIMMPKMDGIEATRQILQVTSPENRPRIIAMTASLLSSIRSRCFEVGMDDCVNKPVLMEDLKSAIEKWGSLTGGEHATINLANVLGRVGHDRRMLQELVETFLRQCPKTLGLLDQSIKSNNREAIKHMAHELKGMCLTMSIPKMYNMALHLETLTEDDLGEAKETLFRLMEQFQKVESALDQRGLIGANGVYDD